MPVQERPEFPAIGAIINLYCGLTLELQLQPHFAGALQLHDKRQLRFVSWPMWESHVFGVSHRHMKDGSLVASGAHLPFQRHGLNSPPCLQSATCRHISVYDLTCRKSGL